MPLMQGATDYAKSTNIKRLMNEGREQDQAVAIAMDVARRTKRATGGNTDNPHEITRRAVADEWSRIGMAGQRPNSSFETTLLYKHSPALQAAKAKTEAARAAYGAVAGVSPEAAGTPQAIALEQTHQETKKKEAALLREVRKHAGISKSKLKFTFAAGGSIGLPKLNVRPPMPRLHTGPIHSAVAGRTDHLPMHVPNKAYVLPADIVSAMGQGNTIAGFKIAKNLPDIFHRQLYGSSARATPYKQGAAAPYGHDMPSKYAKGGDVGDTDDTEQGVPIVAAGGEHVYHPREIAKIGNGDIDLGHDILDAFVKLYRAEHIKTLQKLPGPRRD